MGNKETAIINFKTGYNCAQSVLAPFADQMKIDVDTVLKLSSGFGAGMGRTQNTCGALTGAYMVLGLQYGQQFPDDDSKEKVIALIQEITEKFKEEHGFTNCNELLKVDLKTIEGQYQFNKRNLHEKVCSLCVNSVVSLLEEIITEES